MIESTRSLTIPEGGLSGKILVRILLNLLYPLRCPTCRRLLPAEGEPGLCGDCRDRIRFLQPPFCPQCGKTFAPAATATGAVCPDCWKDRPHFSCCLSACRYEGLIRECIHLFKYRGKTALAKPLAELIASCAREHLALTGREFVVPVPLHPARQREREFNQAELLALHLARDFGLRFAGDNLIRRRNTVAQSTIGPRERHANVEGAFRLRRPEVFRGAVVILVDDVFTTGATVSECARLLREAGATMVIVLTLARGG